MAIHPEITKLTNELNGLKRQQEILHDLAFNLGHAWHSLDVKVCSDLMDMVEGSRGLFERVRDWAVEFDKDWESRVEDAKRDYLSDIDAFSNRKFNELVHEVARFNAEDGTMDHSGMMSVAKGMKGPILTVVSIQVVPVIESSEGYGEDPNITAQFSGPNHETTGWGIYERTSDGLAHHVADAVDERVAEIIGVALAAFHHVEIESRLWKDKPQ